MARAAEPPGVEEALAPVEHPAERLETERLLIRSWCPEDAPLLREAIDASMDHLMAWLPWAHLEPADLDSTRDRLAAYSAAFDSGEEYHFGIFDPGESEVVGGVGFHPRIGDGGLEIGYWIRESRINSGYATEAARALTAEGFQIEGVEQLQIHIDVRNVPSRRVPEKLGYRLAVKRVGDSKDSAGHPRDTLIFRLTRDEWLLMGESRDA